MKARTASHAQVIEFDGHPVATLVFEGRPTWIASQVGEALGYPNGGQRFADKLTGEWSEEFIVGTDFEVVVGERLDRLKSELPTVSSARQGELPTDAVGSRARALTVLYESGLHLALLKTRKPAGRRLRRLLATEVLPQLARTGRYTPEATASTQLPPAAPTPAAAPTVTVTAQLAAPTAGALRWAAERLNASPSAVLALVLDQWAASVAHNRRDGTAPPAGRRGDDNWLMVRVSDHAHEVLSRHMVSLGRAALPEGSALYASAAAARVLEGHALIVDAASAFPPSLFAHAARRGT